jgi:ABC-2 type transport system ATP-binding protein
MNRNSIQLQNLTKVFRHNVAVHNLSLKVEVGKVYGLVGDNGAGKTTTIKMMLGLLHPTQGMIEVLGYDPWRDGPNLKRLVGYVSEKREMYGWMSVEEILWFNAQFYETWDERYADEICRKMELPKIAKVKQLSRGMRAKLALLLAMGHRPELLILDEPSSGLDAIVRREILENIISVIQTEGRTVFFSSHLLDEVERIADHVGIISRGQLLKDAPLEVLKEKSRRIRVVWNGNMPTTERLHNVRLMQGAGKEEAYYTDDFREDLLDQFKAYQPKCLEVETLSLEEIFVETIRAAKESQWR